MVELDCPEALADESKRLNHCVESYEAQCRSGRSHIFSIRGADGNSLSTAEIRLVRHRNGGMSCGLIQHRGLDDGKPTKRCADAIGALLRALKDEPYASRMMALYLTRGCLGSCEGGLPTDIEHLFAVVESVRKTLKGNGKYDRLVEDALRCAGYHPPIAVLAKYRSPSLESRPGSRVRNAHPRLRSSTPCSAATLQPSHARPSGKGGRHENCRCSRWVLVKPHHASRHL